MPLFSSSVSSVVCCPERCMCWCVCVWGVCWEWVWCMCVLVWEMYLCFGVVVWVASDVPIVAVGFGNHLTVGDVSHQAKRWEKGRRRKGRCKTRWKITRQKSWCGLLRKASWLLEIFAFFCLDWHYNRVNNTLPQRWTRCTETHMCDAWLSDTTAMQRCRMTWLCERAWFSDCVIPVSLLIVLIQFALGHRSAGIARCVSPVLFLCVVRRGVCCCVCVCVWGYSVRLCVCVCCVVCCCWEWVWCVCLLGCVWGMYILCFGVVVWVALWRAN